MRMGAESPDVGMRTAFWRSPHCEYEGEDIEEKLCPPPPDLTNDYFGYIFDKPSIW